MRFDWIDLTMGLNNFSFVESGITWHHWLSLVSCELKMPLLTIKLKCTSE